MSSSTSVRTRVRLAFGTLVHHFTPKRGDVLQFVLFLTIITYEEAADIHACNFYFQDLQLKWVHELQSCCEQLSFSSKKHNKPHQTQTTLPHLLYLFLFFAHFLNSFMNNSLAINSMSKKRATYWLTRVGCWGNDLLASFSIDHCWAELQPHGMERLFKAALFTKETHTGPIIVSIYILKTKETRICAIITLQDIYAARANEYLDSSVIKICITQKYVIYQLCI